MLNPGRAAHSGREKREDTISTLKMVKMVKMGLGLSLFGISSALLLGCAVSAGGDAADQAGEERAEAADREDTGDAEEALDNGSVGYPSCTTSCSVALTSCQVAGYTQCKPWTVECGNAVSSSCRMAYKMCMETCKAGSTFGGGIAH